MGNHTIDCEFCGQDQRIYDPCCEAYTQQQKAARAAHDAERERLRQEILKIDPNAIFHSGQLVDCMPLQSVLRLLERASAKLAIEREHHGLTREERDDAIARLVEMRRAARGTP